MLFEFPSAIEAGLAAGKYVQVFNSAGVPLGIARDKLTGQFVGHAVGALASSGVSLNPIVTPIQLIATGAQMYQMHQGFQAIQMGLQSIQVSLGILQATTAVIGVGVAANLAISAVSLWQTLKLREDVKQLKFEIKAGFLDLRRVMKDQNVEIIQQIEKAVQDVKFEQHRIVLGQAYGRFLEATKLIKIAVSCQDLQIRNADLANARQTLTEALADYRNLQLLSELCAAGQLRRFECAWAIEQSIAMTYHLQNQPEALSQCLSQLQDRIRTDVLTALNQQKSEDEINFLFPEIVRIHDHDLAILSLWQDQINWAKSLPSIEFLQQNTDLNSLVISTDDAQLFPVGINVLPEQIEYENLRQKSHPTALLDRLRFMLKPELRRSSEAYVCKQAVTQGRKTLSSNLPKMSDMTIANLYWYFQVRDKSKGINVEVVPEG